MGSGAEGTGRFFPSEIDRSSAVDRFGKIVNSIGDGLYQLDADGYFVAVNDPILEVTGYDRGELLGSHASTILSDDEVDRVEERIGRLIETGHDVTTVEVEVETVAGELIPYELRVSPILGEEGAFEGTVGVARNVSDRQEFERQLEDRKEQAETELEEIFGRISDAFYAVDEEFQFTHLNDRAEELLGFDEEELLGEVLWDRFPEIEASPLVRNAFRRAMEERKTTRFERHSEGIDGWIEAHLYPSATGVSVYFRDITERKERERELQRYKSVVETIRDGVVALDADDRFLMVNEAYCEMTGYSADEILGKPVSFVHREGAIGRAEELVEDMLVGGRDQATLELAIDRADGETVPAEARFGPIEHPDGTTGGVGVIRDLRARKERERALEESERRYRTLVDHFPEGAVGLFDEDLRYIAAGGELLDKIGDDVGDPVGDDILDRYPPDVAEKVEPHFRRALAGEANRFEVAYLGRYLSARVLPVRNSEGEVFAGMLLVQDFTDRREQERELERTLDLLNKTKRIANVGGWEVDPETGDTFWTDHLFDLLDVEYAEQLSWDTALDVYYSDVDRSIVEAALEDAMETGEQFDIEARFPRPSGDIGWLRIIGEPHVENGDVETIRGAVQDITELKRREIDLERFETIVETVNDGIYTVNEDGVFTWVNAEYAALVGYSREELIGEDVSLVVTEDIAERAQAVEAELQVDPENPPKIEAELRRSDGTTVSAEATFALFGTDDGYERVGVARDITERKERERRLRRQQEELVALNQLNEVIRHISHAVIETSSREEVERTVVDRLGDQYAHAWIGSIERGGQRIRTRATSGGKPDVIDDVELSIEEVEEAMDHREPTIRAITNRASQFADHSVLDSDVLARMSKMADSDVRAVAAVPIVQDERLFGVLTVYATEVDAFSGPVGDIIEHLGQVVGHAVQAIDQRRALIGNSIFELEVLINDPSASPLLDAAAEAGSTIFFERTLPTADGQLLQFVSVTGMDADQVIQVAEEVEEISEAHLIREGSDSSYFELHVVDSPLFSTITDYGGRIDQLRMEGKEIRLVIQLPRTSSVREVVEAIQSMYVDTEVLAQRTKERQAATSRELDTALSEDLTNRQRTALETAYFAGFFEWPRETTGEEVADMLDLSPSTFTEHLRHAERKIFTVMLDPASSDS